MLLGHGQVVRRSTLNREIGGSIPSVLSLTLSNNDDREYGVMVAQGAHNPWVRVRILIFPVVNN